MQQQALNKTVWTYNSK